MGFGSDVCGVGVDCAAATIACLLAKSGDGYREEKSAAPTRETNKTMWCLWLCRTARTILRNCCCFIGFEGDSNVGILFKAYFVTVLVRQRIFDTQFFVQRIGTFNPYLCLFRFVWMSRRDDFLNLGGQRYLWLFCHKEKGFWVRRQS
jgi:hypothetical protein